ncbi:MAG: diacylglycerol kinase family lipid kinase [Chitinophagales bacterium]|nr:diacylglycerol kinase family lipid kinase [Chitinophagales bacterium]
MDNGWFVIINPISGGRKGLKTWQQTEQFLKDHAIPFQYAVTSQALDASDLSNNAILQGSRKILLIGGDGTINEVVNGVFTQDKVPTAEITIGILSTGTGNDFIKTLNVPAGTQALPLLLQNKTKLIDVGLATYYLGQEQRQRYFINVAGMAFDAAVTRYANLHKSNAGKLQYYWSLVKTLMTYKAGKINLVTDTGIELNETCFCLDIGNGKYAGGGMMVAPQAVPDDGQFHITYFTDLSRWEVIQNIGKLFKGTFLGHPKVKTFTAKKVAVTAEELTYLEVEGETLGHTPCTFQIIPSSIKVLVP